MAHVTNKLCVWPAGVAMFFFVIGLVFPSTGIRSDGVILGVGAVFAVPFWLLRRGHTYVAAVLVLTLWWLGIGALACTSSGATAPAVIVYLVLIVASGLMGRTLFLWVTTLVCLLSLVALFALNQSGLVEPGRGIPNPGQPGESVAKSVVESGGPGRFSSRSSHRTERAGLPHSALRVSRRMKPEGAGAGSEHDV